MISTRVALKLVAFEPPTEAVAADVVVDVVVGVVVDVVVDADAGESSESEPTQSKNLTQAFLGSTLETLVSSSLLVER